MIYIYHLRVSNKLFTINVYGKSMKNVRKAHVLRMREINDVVC